MKSKVVLYGLAIAFVCILGSCKSRQSAYKAAYEKAKQKEFEETQANKSNQNQPPVEAVTPVTKSDNSYDNVSVQKERVTTVSGTGLKRFSVVIGSFMNKTNATALKERMEAQGFSVILAQNEKNMFRVIVASYDDKPSAAAERDSIKSKYAPEFQDAWLLEKQE